VAMKSFKFPEISNLLYNQLQNGWRIAENLLTFLGPLFTHLTIGNLVTFN